MSRASWVIWLFMFGLWKRIRKPAYELTIADFDRFPAWDNCLDEEGKPGQDESTMKPIRPKGPLRYPDFYGMVGTDFRTASGRRLFGVIQPSGDPGFTLPYLCSPELLLERRAGEYLQHSLLDKYNGIVTSTGMHVGLTLALGQYQPDNDVLPLIGLVYRILQLSRDEMFPLTATPRAPIEGWPSSFQLPGFLRPPIDGKSAVLR